MILITERLSQMIKVEEIIPCSIFFGNFYFSWEDLMIID